MPEAGNSQHVDSLSSKLRDEQAVRALAALCVEVWLSEPVAQLVPVEGLAGLARQALTGWLASDQAVTALGRGVEALVNELNATPKPLKSLVANDVRQALRTIAGRPFSPDKQLVLTVIDRKPTRELVRALLLDFVLEFARKASAPVAGVARGLGGLARLAGDAVKSRSGSLGSLVGAVGNEVERQMEKRAVEFVDAALSGVFEQLADAISDPRQADEAAELRVAVLDGVLELTMPQLAREVTNADVTGAAEVLRAGLTRWVASEAATVELRRFAELAVKHEGPRTLREVLSELGLLSLVQTTGVDLLTARIREVVASAAFQAWEHAPTPPNA